MNEEQGSDCFENRLREEVMTAKDSLVKETSPIRKKSKYDKFHKLFKAVPEEEYPLNDYSCAFMGDILLQGNIYVSQNWICFYSRLRGRGRRLQIPLEKVISITREKTALVFPNAIGFQTAEEKYCFGSFLTRDTTYKFLTSVWKKSQSKSSEQNENDLEFLRETRTLTSAVSSPSFPIRAAESDHNSGIELTPVEENSVSIQEEPHPSDINCNNQLLQSTSSSNQNNNLHSSDSDDVGLCNLCGTPDSADKNLVHNVKTQSIIRNENGKKAFIRVFNISYFFRCLEVHKMMAAFSELSLKLQKVPRTNLLLAVCSLMILFLLLSAVALTYKILLLQAQIDGKEVWSPASKQSWKENLYTSFYNLQSDSHTATVRQLHEVLQANLQVLEEVGLSLKSLQLTTGNLQSCRDMPCKTKT